MIKIDRNIFVPRKFSCKTKAKSIPSGICVSNPMNVIIKVIRSVDQVSEAANTV